MNQHLENKKKYYDSVASSWCFLNNLVGLATIELNITEMCSRQCKFCPRFDSSVYKSQPLHMSVGTTFSIAQKCNDERYAGVISLVGFGEPLLHPNTPGLIQVLRKRICNQIHMITNGDDLTVELISELKWSGLNKIVVSCYDGPQAKDKFESILSNSGIEYYIKELWGDANIVAKNNDFNSRTGIVPVESSGGKQCYLPFYKLFIDWNGDVVLCSNDWHRKETGLGNINQNTLKEIWFSEKMISIRDNLRRGDRCDKACVNCNANGTLMGQGSFDLLK